VGAGEDVAAGFGVEVGTKIGVGVGLNEEVGNGEGVSNGVVEGCKVGVDKTFIPNKLAPVLPSAIKSIIDAASTIAFCENNLIRSLAFSSHFRRSILLSYRK